MFNLQCVKDGSGPAQVELTEDPDGCTAQECNCPSTEAPTYTTSCPVEPKPVEGETFKQNTIRT